MAKSLGKGKESINDFTFHSFRRSSASAAADDGATAQQMIDFYGWKSVSMPQEYISTSKKAINNMAGLLKLETVTSSSSAASSSGAVTSDPTAFLVPAVPSIPAASSFPAVPAVPLVPAVPSVPADSSLQDLFFTFSSFFTPRSFSSGLFLLCSSP